MTLKSLCICSLMILISTIAKGDETAEKPYGPAGCGLGSIILGKDGPPIVSATINFTGLQSFAIVSGTSDCVDPATNPYDAGLKFYEFNRVAIEKEISRGNGPYLASLGTVMGCSLDGSAYFQLQKTWGGQNGGLNYSDLHELICSHRRAF